MTSWPHPAHPDLLPFLSRMPFSPNIAFHAKILTNLALRSRGQILYSVDEFCIFVNPVLNFGSTPAFWECHSRPSLGRQKCNVQQPHDTEGLKRLKNLTVNRQKRLCFIVTRQNCARAVLTVKTFQGNSNLTISPDLHWFLTPEEYLERELKNQFPCSQKHSPRHYKTLEPAYNLKIFRNFICERPRKPPKHNS